ncbi:MAG TPA: hypothetical protein VE843_17620, partial [Ktedonobacteraceae bacterium]|nr:hypothetical protein [Ktedonobacteraceae bacterium]
GQPPISPSVLTATPYSFSTPGDPNCSYNANSGWVCNASLSNYKNSGRDLNWTASSNGVSGATFIPSHGVLSPGQTTQVTITIPNMVCPSQGDLIFKGPGNITDILWNCGTSAWSFSPHNFKANTDCRYSAKSGWTCIGTLAEASGSEGNLKWSASGLGLNGINLNPSGGILSPNQPVRVTVSVPNTRCPSSAIINFLASGEMPIAVPWLCGKPPVLIVNPTSLSASTDCNSRASGWQCTVMLEPAAGSQGNLSWFAFTGLDGVTFNPLSGTLSQGKRMTVTISIPNDDCLNDAFYFIGPGNIVKVRWKCTFVPPVIEVSPKSFAAYSANCPYDGYS